MLAESVPLAVRLDRIARKARERADTLAATVDALPKSRKARRYASIRRWSAIATVMHRRAVEARRGVEFRCTECAMVAAMGTDGVKAWSEAADTGVLALKDGTALRVSDEAPRGYGRYGRPAPTLTIARVGFGKMAGMPDMVIPLDPDALLNHVERECIMDYVTPTPGERVDGLTVLRSKWSHPAPSVRVDASRCVVTCKCGARYVVGLAHRCEYVTRKGDNRPNLKRHSSPSARAEVRRVKANARTVAGVALNVADVMARARAAAQFEIAPID